MTNKKFGRVGDTAIIGAGTYADDRGCAVSGTGAGEYFIRVGVAHAISDAVRIGHDGAQAAAACVRAREHRGLGCDG